MDKFTLYFKVNHQIIFLENATEVVSQSKNYINAHFSFSKEWDGMLKTAIFKRGTLVYHVLIDENNDCIVPYEVMEEAGAFEVSVFAGELITAVACTVKVLKSGYEAGGAPSEPTPTVYEQIIKMLEEIEAGDVPQEKIDEAVENYLSTHPIAGITEEQCKVIVRDYIAENRDTLKGDKGADGRDGVDGRDGNDGLSAYEIAKLNGFVGSEEAWLESLKGKDGRDGVDGENGKDGIDGIDGKDGDGFTDEQITLLANVLYAVTFTDESGKAKVDELIASLRNGERPIPPTPTTPKLGDVNVIYDISEIANIRQSSINQGFTMDSTKFYGFTSSDNRYGAVIPRSNPTTITKKVVPSGMGHQNGAVYCWEDSNIYIIIPADRYDEKGIAVYNPSSNTIVRNIEYGTILDMNGSPVVPIGIAYDKPNNHFIVRQVLEDGTIYILTYDYDWTCLSQIEISEANLPSGTGQNMGFDGKYVYILRAKVGGVTGANELRAFNYQTGEYSRTITLSGNECEDMEYDWDENKYYVAYYKASYFCIDEITLTSSDSN